MDYVDRKEGNKVVHIPEKVRSTEIDKRFMSAGFDLVSSGKVRQMYEYALASHPEYLSVATDRLSIFDFVLPITVPKKGEVLTALTIFWLEDVLTGVPHHLLAYGAKAAKTYVSVVGANRDLAARLLVIAKNEMIPIECIVRGYLTGSGWRTYQESGEVCGHKLSDGLHDGSKLEMPIFTPTTKAEVGHDEDVNAAWVNENYGNELGEFSLDIYGQARDFCLAKGIVIADTKFENGRNKNGILTLCDEVLTPDSSRFWDYNEWLVASAKGKSPSGYDKEPARQWGLIVETPFGVTGLNKLKPDNWEHLDFVDNLEVPDEVATDTTQRYLEIFGRITGMSLEEFQSERMGLN